MFELRFKFLINFFLPIASDVAIPELDVSVATK